MVRWGVLGGKTATWMIRLCEKTRSAGGRCGHGRRWPLAGRASRRAVRTARAGVRPGQVAPGGVRLPWGAAGGAWGASLVLATGRGRRARHAAADAGPAGRAPMGLEGGAEGAAAVHP